MSHAAIESKRPPIRDRRPLHWNNTNRIWFGVAEMKNIYSACSSSPAMERLCFVLKCIRAIRHNLSAWNTSKLLLVFDASSGLLSKFRIGELTSKEWRGIRKFHNIQLLLPKKPTTSYSNSISIFHSSKNLLINFSISLSLNRTDSRQFLSNFNDCPESINANFAFIAFLHTFDRRMLDKYWILRDAGLASNQFSWNCLLFVGDGVFLSRPCAIVLRLTANLLLVKWFARFNTVALDGLVPLTYIFVFWFLFYILGEHFHQAIARWLAVVFPQWHRETCKWMFANKISSFVFAIGWKTKSEVKLNGIKTNTERETMHCGRGGRKTHTTKCKKRAEAFVYV